jgi:hypothetical protein
MTLQIDTVISNKSPSERLIGMFVDLVNNTSAIFDSVKRNKGSISFRRLQRF